MTANNPSVEQRARELLAEEYGRAGLSFKSVVVRDLRSVYFADDTLAALRAITRALTAPAGGEVERREIARGAAEQDALVYGIGFLVDGRYVSPTRVDVFTPPTPSTQRYPCPKGPLCVGRDCPFCSNFTPALAAMKGEKP